MRELRLASWDHSTAQQLDGLKPNAEIMLYEQLVVNNHKLLLHYKGIKSRLLFLELARAKGDRCSARRSVCVSKGAELPAGLRHDATHPAQSYTKDVAFSKRVTVNDKH